MKYYHPQTGLTIFLSNDVVEVMMKYQQRNGEGAEAGGQLFARFVDGVVHIVFAGEPKRNDRRWWKGFIPCRKSERREISDLYQKGLHFVGDWHTHPEKVPKYSCRDLRSIQDCFCKSKHELSGLLMIIVGYANSHDEAIRIWFANQYECCMLLPHIEG